MGKRVKMKPWKGWAVVRGDTISPIGGCAVQETELFLLNDDERYARVLVTELPAPRAMTKKKGKK